MSELVARASSGTLTSGAPPAAARPAPAAPARGGSFLDSPEFAQKLERRKQLAEAASSPKQAESCGGDAADGAPAGGLSYLELLAEKIAARQQQQQRGAQ